MVTLPVEDEVSANTTEQEKYFTSSSMMLSITWHKIVYYLLLCVDRMSGTIWIVVG